MMVLETVLPNMFQADSLFSKYHDEMEIRARLYFELLSVLMRAHNASLIRNHLEGKE